MPSYADYQKQMQQKHSVPITPEQIAHAYAMAVLLGYEKNIDEFKLEYEKLYSSALKVL